MSYELCSWTVILSTASWTPLPVNCTWCSVVYRPPSAPYPFLALYPRAVLIWLYLFFVCRRFTCPSLAGSPRAALIPYAMKVCLFSLTPSPCAVLIRVYAMKTYLSLPCTVTSRHACILVWRKAALIPSLASCLYLVYALLWLFAVKVYYASEVTEGNKKTTFTEELGEQPLPEDTAAGESDR